MNVQLFYSSLINGIVMVFGSLGFYQPSLWSLYFLTYIGIMTSIVNHGFSYRLAKIVDRALMCILVLVYVYYVIRIQTIRKKLTLSILAFCILAFFVSKIRHFKDLRSPKDVVNPQFSGETKSRMKMAPLYHLDPLYQGFEIQGFAESSGRSKFEISAKGTSGRRDEIPYENYLTLSTHIHTITHVLATLTFLFIVSNVES